MCELIRPFEIFTVSTYPGIQEDRYMVGDLGNIYDRQLDRNKKLSPHKSNGYVMGKFKMKDGTRKTISTHRLTAYDLVEGYSEDEGKVFVDHGDFNRSNNKPKNLEWVTQSENNKRRYNNPDNTFTNPPIYYGEDHPSTKTDIELGKSICSKISEGEPLIDIFRSFGYNKSEDNIKLYYLITDIKYKKRWTSISNNYF